MADGMLSAQQFEEGARSFARIWEFRSDAERLWTWAPSGNNLEPGYLQLEGVPRSSPLSSEPSGNPAALLSCRDDEPDQAMAWQPSGQHLYTFSIAYLPSYCVPILLFQGQHLDGAPLSWEETLSDLPEASQATARADNARWMFITQQEHPVKRVPMHSIHPCETAKLMSLLLARDPAAKQRECSEAGTQQTEALCLSSEAQQTGTAQNLKAADGSMEGSAHQRPQNASSQSLMAGETDDLRYMCGWYSIVAPVVGLPVPLGLYGNGTSAIHG